MNKNKPLGYYPGCSGLGTSIEYDRSTRVVAACLNMKFEEIADWSCCGSTPAHTIDHALSTALSARNFAQAEKQGITDMVTPCPSCLKNLRTAIHRMRDEHVGPKADKLLGGDSPKAEHTVRSVLQVMHEDIPREDIVKQATSPLTGLKVVPYYGCLMSRPAELMQFGDPENPMAMEDLLAAVGAEVLPFPLKVECCGASMGIPCNEAVTRLSGKIVDLAFSLGADVIAVACPLCQMNLDMRQSQIEKAAGKKYGLPVMYYTQLLGLAFGLPREDLGLNKLIVDPKPVLDKLAAQKTAKTEDAA